VLGGGPILQIPPRGTASSRQSVGRDPPKLAKNTFDWGAISRKRCMMRTCCQHDLQETTQLPKLYAPPSSEVTFDTAWPWKSNTALASYGQPFLPKLSSCYCALHFPIVPCHGGNHEKVRGTEKKNSCAPHFWNASGAAAYGAMDSWKYGWIHRIHLHRWNIWSELRSPAVSTAIFAFTCIFSISSSTR